MSRVVSDVQRALDQRSYPPAGPEIASDLVQFPRTQSSTLTPVRHLPRPYAVHGSLPFRPEGCLSKSRAGQ